MILQLLQQKGLSSFLLFALIFLMVPGCKKEKPQDPPGVEQKELEFFEKEAVPYQYITGIMPTGVVPAEIAENLFLIKIGDSTAYGYRLSTLAWDATYGKHNYYAFQVMIPEMPAGSYPCVISASGGAICKADLSIKAGVSISDPEAYISDFTSDMSSDFADISAEYDKSVQNGEITQAKADSLKQEIKAALDLIPTYYAELNTEEKRLYVHLLQSNKYLLDEFKEELSQYNLPRGVRSEPQDCSQLWQKAETARQAGYEDEAKTYEFQAHQCESTNAGHVLMTSNSFLEKLKAAHVAAKSQYANTTGWLGAAAVFAYVKTLGSGYVQIATDEMDKAKEYLNSLVNLDYLEAIHRKAEESFVSEKEYKITAGVFATNMTHASAASVSELKAIVDLVDKYNGLIAELSDFIPFVREMKLPSSRSEKIYFTEYTIDDLSDSRIKVENIKIAGGRAVKFTMDKMTGDVSFTFRIKIDSRFKSVEETIHAVLTPKAPTIMDIDGNVYNILQIGGQWWMKENLKTTRYRNGDAITHLPNTSAWGSTNSGAYTAYDNEVYGKLYNYYAATDSRGICPQGWHIPSSDELVELRQFSGGYYSGGSLKATSALWQSPNAGATNITGFSALPGGVIYQGSLAFLGARFFLWTSTPHITNLSGAEYGTLYSDNTAFDLHGVLDKTGGASCRCVKD